MTKLLTVFLFVCCSLTAQVKFSRTSDRISVEIDGKPFGDLILSPDGNKPYLFPLRTAQGIPVTRSFPMERVAGESSDHPHHRGMFFSHGDISGVNFWATEAADKATNKGSMRLTKIAATEGGTESGTITVLFDGLDPKGNLMMKETRTMTFYGGSDRRIVDFDVSILAMRQLKFVDTKEGTFGIRLADALTEDRGGKMVNAEGAQTEKQVWGKRSDWVDYSGTIDGQLVGVAIMDNPANPLHPTYWQARGYGLFAANPFGVHDFTADASRDGSMTVEPGKSVRFRYRVLIHSGDYQNAGIAAAYRAYCAGK